MKIVYKGKEFNMPRRDIYVMLRQDNMSYQEIGDFVGVRRQAVHLSLKKYAPELCGIREYPELENPDIYKLSDVEIATKYNVAINRVIKYRREFGEKQTTINVRTRQLRFVREVFGRSYKPGKRFHFSLLQFLQEYKPITDLEAQRMVNFYIRGCKDSPSLRVQRVYVRNKLKAIIKEQKKEFVAKALEYGVIHAK